MEPFSINAPDGRQWQTPPPKRPRRGRWLWLAVAAVAILVVVGVLAALLVRSSNDGEIDRTDGTVLPPSAPTVTLPDSAAVTTSCAMQQGLINRDCAIITPPGVAPDVKLPVVVLLHGLGDGPIGVRSSGAWLDAVIEHRFMLVTPQGVADSWNAGQCCAIARATGIDDIAYLTTLIDEVALRPDVDPDRIYAAGFSNGGMMVYRLLCDSADRLAGAAVVSGARVADCSPSRPTSLLHIHGTTDEAVPYQGGVSPVGLLLGVNFPSATQSVESFGQAQGCSAESSESTEQTVTRATWSGCTDDRQLELITIDPWPHQWPLDGPLNATDEVLAFFDIA